MILQKYEGKQNVKMSEYPRSGSKLMSIQEREKRERKSVVLTIVHLPGPISLLMFDEHFLVVLKQSLVGVLLILAPHKYY